MQASFLAQQGYGSASRATIDPRAAEYDVFCRVTADLRTAAALPEGFDRQRALIIAAHDNLRLWDFVAYDVASDHNGLPDALKRQLLSLASFMRRVSPQVANGSMAPDDVIAINTSIMTGLKHRMQTSSETGELHGGA